MPALSLVVCVHNERDLLVRLLEKANGCFDDLVVVHDGEETTNVRSLVERAGGRFYERPREYQQESHWPFAWERAAHDWIIRLDADEFPSDEMKQWLQRLRQGVEPDENISGYTCIWPLWDGRRTVSRKLPVGRNFLFHRQRVRFFGMAEQVPVPDGHYESLDLVLHHQPLRKSYGLHNVLMRRQAYRWRRRIAQSLLGEPTDLFCWRWNTDTWPADWEQIRQRPWRTFFSRLILGMLRTLRDQWKEERWFFPNAAINGPIHHALICLEYWRLRRLQKGERGEKQTTSKPE
ncbi:MAG: glycosyltransferase [Chthoniobacterales bacterium]